MDIKILYEDKHICVCLKPAGVISEDGGMPQLLSEKLGGSFFCVHRLDKVVGGVMVYAKTSRAAALLSQMNADRKLQKHYLAIVPDRLEAPEGVMEDLLYRDREKNKSFVVKRMRRGVKDAKLEYRTVESRDGLALLKIRLHTGRSHQIRCQLSSRRCPIMGDGRYGSELRQEDIALWSCSLDFEHPFSHEAMSFSALPEGGLWEKFEYISQDQR